MKNLSPTLFKNFRLVSHDFQSQTAKMAMLVDQGIIQWLGPQAKVKQALQNYLQQNRKNKSSKKNKEFDLKNKLVFPSFIECHTHTVFAGSRADEFEMRLSGVSYAEIAQKGGGILSTMKKTRAISKEKLKKISQKYVDEFLRQGVSTLEIKSGYALDLKNEIKMLEVAKNLKGPDIVTTFLGAHAKPPEYSSYEEYLDFLIEKVLPVIKKKKLSNRVDIFIEKNFFEAESAEKYLRAAQLMGFSLVVHANQLSDSGGAQLAQKLSALSADHVIHVDDKTIAAFQNSKTVAVCLPLADLYMQCTYPPARKLIDAGAKVALATDFNPGSSPSQDLMLAGLLARLEMKMSLPEVFQAYTINAATALGRDHQEGLLEVGKFANFICTEADLTDFFYSAGRVPEHELFIRGYEVLRPS